MILLLQKFNLEKTYQYLLIALAFLIPLTVAGANLIIVIIVLLWVFSGEYKKKYSEIIHPGDSAYLKPFVQHNFRGSGKLLALRLGGKITGDSQRELSFVGKTNVKRAINETMQWFTPKTN